MTKVQFAGLLGLTKQALQHHLKSKEAPPVGDVAAWEEFLATHGNMGSTPAALRTKIARKRLEILTETKEAMARKAAKERGETADKSEVRIWMRSFMSFLFGELDRVFGMELPGSGKGLSELELKRRADAAIAQLKASLLARFGEHL